MALIFPSMPLQESIIDVRTGAMSRAWIAWFEEYVTRINDIEFTQGESGVGDSVVQSNIEELRSEVGESGAVVSELQSSFRLLSGELTAIGIPSAQIINRIEEIEALIVSLNRHREAVLPFYLGSLVKFDKDGILTCGTYVRHIQISVIVAGLAANQPTLVDIGTAGGFEFASSGTQQELHFKWKVPDDWDGTDITAEINWCPNSGAMTNPDAVKWTFEYRAVAEGESIVSGTLATQSITYDTTTSQDVIVHSQVVLAAADANQPLTELDHVYVRCFRDTAVANDFAGTVVATAFEIIYNSTAIPTGN